MSAAATVRTTCPYCGVGCGILATPQPDGTARIEGDPEHPANFGRLCSKGAALGETLSLDGRLLHPLIAGQPASWDAALDLVAQTFGETIAAHGPDAVAFYVSGQLLTEDYYVANKLMKGFIGSANIDTNSRLCMASSVAGHRRAFGSDTVPGVYEDLEEADLVVLVGSNLAWCHPVLYQRLAAAKEKRRSNVVVIDPRRTATAELADLHLALAPGADVALFNGLLAYLAAHGHADVKFVAAHTQGLEAALAAADTPGLAGATGLTDAQLATFYRLFAASERVVTVFSQGVNQSSTGTDKVNAIINCHLLTGQIGRPGMGPFSVTGQPNAMGGREVGGLANQLAAHMEIENADHRRIVRDFWRAPRLAERPGLKAVDLFRAVGDGRIKALWIMATNPADSMPDADAVVQALRTCPFVVVSDIVRDTDTARHAHVLLPAAGWGEKDGTVTNSERRISRQRAFLAPPGEALPDWRIVCDVARRMGFSGFEFDGPAAILREHAALSAAGNDGSRDFDLGALADLDDQAYARLPPVQWPQRRGASASPPKRFFADGKFFTADGRARFVPTPARPPASELSDAAPLVLNTGRIRDQWHTMTRTAKTPRLLRHYAEPFAELHPADAARFGIMPADLVTVESARGAVVLRALITERQRPGSVFVPMHWTGQSASRGRIDALVGPHTDPVSGQPELKFTPVAARRFDAAWYGFAVVAFRPRSVPVEYWALAAADGGWRVELAGLQEPVDWESFARSLLADIPTDATWLGYGDAGAGEARLAAFAGERLLAALFVARTPVEVSRGWAIEQLGRPHPAAARARVLAGRAGAAEPDQGAIICSCLNVGAKRIAAAVRSHGCVSVDAIGAATGAGTSCGSCRSEIARLLTDALRPAA